MLAEAGEVLTAGRIGLLAAAGLTRVRVGRQPVVGLLATGSELHGAGAAAGARPDLRKQSPRSGGAD